jgi:hypothetical protein
LSLGALLIVLAIVVKLAQSQLGALGGPRLTPAASAAVDGTLPAAAPSLQAAPQQAAQQILRAVESGAAARASDPER